MPRIITLTIATETFQDGTYRRQPALLVRVVGAFLAPARPSSPQKPSFPPPEPPPGPGAAAAGTTRSTRCTGTAGTARATRTAETAAGAARPARPLRGGGPPGPEREAAGVPRRRPPPGAPIRAGPSPVRRTCLRSGRRGAASCRASASRTARRAARRTARPRNRGGRPAVGASPWSGPYRRVTHAASSTGGRLCVVRAYCAPGAGRPMRQGCPSAGRAGRRVRGRWRAAIRDHASCHTPSFSGRFG